jgi:hypothetical protein
MKSIRSRSLAAFLTAAAFVSAPLAAKHEVPFHGTIETVENPSTGFPIVHKTLEGVGQATLLGRFTMIMQGTINLLTRTGSGSAEFVAADGSRIQTNVAGAATPTGIPNQLRIVEVFTVVTGTGRFAGVTGVITLDRLLDMVTSVSDGTLSGMLLPPVGNKP